MEMMGGRWGRPGRGQSTAEAPQEASIHVPRTQEKVGLEKAEGVWQACGPWNSSQGRRRGGWGSFRGL